MPPIESSTLPERLPVMPLRSTIVYPYGVIGVQVGMASTLDMLAAFPVDSLLVAAVVAPGGPEDPIDPHSLEKVGVACRLSDRLNMPGGTIQATVQGMRRVWLRKVEHVGEHFVAQIEAAVEVPPEVEVAEPLVGHILTTLEVLASQVDRIPEEVPRILRMNVGDFGRFADLVATLANFSVDQKDTVLQHLNIADRLTFVLGELERELKRLRQVEEAEESAEAAAAAEAGAAEAPAGAEPAATPAARTAAAPAKLRDLRQQIKRLQAELGEIDPAEREAIEILRKLEPADLPSQVAARARAEVEHLRTVTSAAEASEIRTYLDWLLNLPWRRRTAPRPAELELETVQRALDEELLGLDEPKSRLLDYLAVARLRGDLQGPIPCLVGPPDVGKASLVIALARGLGRQLTRLDLGGRGESQLAGIRRTRAGAQPGKIIGAFRDVGGCDPVFLLHEMDEIGLGKVDGDPIEVMEEVLRWDSRVAFIDRYLDLPFDLTNTLFIATAQDFFRVPRDLRELMVEIRIAGYTSEEKVLIARERLLPRLIHEHGLDSKDVAFGDDALFYLARGYARDAGLGTLQRVLSTLLRTRARAKAQGELEPWNVDADRIESILGLPRYTATAAENFPEIGVVTGLAWTAAGGELMFIEALKMPGSGRLIITGLLGDVMRESVNAAYSYVRSRGEALGIEDEAFRESDIHVHFPVGAIPKDGPSAGIAVTLALASTLSNRPVRHDLAMSGEVTLRGKVLEIGGVKEKVLAAYRAGLREVILPQGNERDLRDVPDNVRDNIEFHFVARMDEVIELALLDSAAQPVAAAPRKRAATPIREARAARKTGRAGS